VANELHEDLTLAATASAKATHDFFQLLVAILDLTREAGGAAAALPRDVFDELERFFLRFLQRGSIRDALAPLFTRKGINDEMRRTDKTFLHGHSGLESKQVIHERLVNTAAKLPEGLGQHKVGLRGIALVFSQATGVHDRKIGA
jgi:hypothetical protein